jgi:hypothetical protein
VTSAIIGYAYLVLIWLAIWCRTDNYATAGTLIMLNVCRNMYMAWLYVVSPPTFPSSSYPVGTVPSNLISQESVYSFGILGSMSNIFIVSSHSENHIHMRVSQSKQGKCIGNAMLHTLFWLRHSHMHVHMIQNKLIQM